MPEFDDKSVKRISDVVLEAEKTAKDKRFAPNPGRPVWLGGDKIGNGQYQYQVFQMVAQNQRGWDWVRAHP